jgi:hypothetical protein
VKQQVRGPLMARLAELARATSRTSGLSLSFPRPRLTSPRCGIESSLDG